MKLLRALGVMLALGALAAGFAYYRVARPYGHFSGTVYVDFPRGTSTDGIAAELAKAGVIGSRLDFWLARMAERGHTLQAGEYAFSRPASALDVVGRIARGDIFYLELVVPEGKNMFDIGAEAAPLGIFTADDFVKAARNPALIHDLDPKAPTLEGYLFPSTYRLNHKTTAEQLCRSMTERFRAAWRSLNAPAGVHDAVTLASLVEKEGKLDGERPLIAAVFTNRLRLGMKLDCDPTTIYAAELLGVYRGTIYRSDLDRDHPYNTYSHAGLPPGPIANPGIRSLEAALHPADSDALYFVRRPDDSGGHEFSNSLAAHTQAVEKYRHGSRQFR
ncbi:MAG TPA: endolytic transglycosylase MltG [Bryobacteraceae bacterium]|jgi:UPF0755 protein|nr:endolytic transglycosylase MltG [Bryobacteraceae bacterium]